MTQTTSPPTEPIECRTPTAMPIWGPPPLLPGENSQAFNDLLARVSGHVRPTDILEELWVHDVLNLTWEHLRWRRLQNFYLQSAMPRVLEEALGPLLNEPAPGSGGRTSLVGRIQASYEAFTSGPELLRLWRQGNAAATQRIDELLAAKGLTIDGILAQSAAAALGEMERFNRLIANTEWRRNMALQEIERHRAMFADKLRRTIKKVDELELRPCAAGTPVLSRGDVQPLTAAAAARVDATPRDADPSPGAELRAGHPQPRDADRADVVAGVADTARADDTAHPDDTARSVDSRGRPSFASAAAAAEAEAEAEAEGATAAAQASAVVPQQPAVEGRFDVRRDEGADQEPLDDEETVGLGIEDRVARDVLPVISQQVAQGARSATGPAS